MRKKLYPYYMDRRDRTSVNQTGHARRFGDKVFSFVAFLLLTFLVNWALGADRRPAVVERECKIEKQDGTCADVYVPSEEPIELDDVELNEADLEEWVSKSIPATEDP